MPVLINVAAGDKFFGPARAKEGHSINHAVCIDKYDSKTGALVINNQWGSAFNWETASVLGSPYDLHPAANIDDFYPATLNHSSAENST